MKKLTFHQVIFSIVLFFALVGLIVSFILTLETIDYFKDASVKLSCNLNAVVNCGTVMASKEAQLFGFPNTLLGLIGYSSMATMAAIFLFQPKMNKYLALFILLGSFLSVLFSDYLLHTSIFKIRALCPYCLTSGFAATNIFFALAIYVLKHNYFEFKEKTFTKIDKFIDKKYYIPIIVGWYTFIVLLVLIQFWGN